MFWPIVFCHICTLIINILFHICLILLLIFYVWCLRIVITSILYPIKKIHSNWDPNNIFISRGDAALCGALVLILIIWYFWNLVKINSGINSSHSQFRTKYRVIQSVKWKSVFGIGFASLNTGFYFTHWMTPFYVYPNWLCIN